ncbi:hypothetical protein Ahia01_001156400, partial [Argonauta hians]
NTSKEDRDTAASEIAYRKENYYARRDDSLGPHTAKSALRVSHRRPAPPHLLTPQHLSPRPDPPVSCRWSFLDLASMVELARPFLPIASQDRIEPLSRLLCMAYTGCCTNPYLTRRVEAVIYDILNLYYLTNHKLPDTAKQENWFYEMAMAAMYGDDDDNDEDKETREKSAPNRLAERSRLMPTLMLALTGAVVEGVTSQAPSSQSFLQSPILHDVISSSKGISDVTCQLFGMSAQEQVVLVAYLSRRLTSQMARVSVWRKREANPEEVR